MNAVNKIAAVSGVLLFLAFVLFVVGFGINELRYFLYGKTATATIDSASKEFAGFANDEVSGTAPTYRYRITYSFDADGYRQHGETTLSDAYSAVVGKFVSVQYVTNLPRQHRVLTPSLKLFQICYFLALTLIAAWLSYSAIHKYKRFRSPTTSAADH